MGLVRIAQLMQEAVDGYESATGTMVAGIYNNPPAVQLTGPDALLTVVMLGGKQTEKYYIAGQPRVKIAATIEDTEIFCIAEGVE